MKRVLLISGVLIVGFAVWFFRFRKTEEKSEKYKPMTVSRIESKDVNNSINSLINAYLSMKDAFIDADTAKIKITAGQFIQRVDSLKLDDLKKDSAKEMQSLVITTQTQAGDMKSNAVAIPQEKDVTEMRKDFKMVSENLYDFLRSIKAIGYNGQKLYWQNCPMALGEGKDASWISNSEEIMNPYLGKNHPEYKGTMLHCGETKDSVGQ